MNHTQGRIRAAAMSLLLPLTVGFGALPSPAAHAAPLPPVPVRTLLTDVDGDKTYDTVQLFDLGSDAYRLTVTTTKGVTSSVGFTSQLISYMDATDVLYGAVTLDGRRGSELIVKLWNRELLGYRDDVDLAVYTWRSGGLVAEKAPASSYLKRWHFGGAYHRDQAYRVFDKAGRRYVDVTGLSWKNFRWVGKVTRSVWKKGAWVKVSTRSVRYKKGAAGPAWYDGPPVLLGQAHADFNGDGVAEEFRYYRYVDNGWGGKAKVKVTTTTGRVVNKVVPYSLMIGAGALDGVAGDELVFLEDSQDGTYQVLTWRNGKLVYEAGPGTSGSKATDYFWWGCGDESGTTFTFSTAADGSRHLVRTCIGEERTTRSSEYRWQGAKWVYLSSWDASPTAEELAALGRGIQGVTFTKP